jgi:glycosyltransferase involved in cell wall biosynthesis
MAEVSVQVPVKNGGSKFSRFLHSLALQDLDQEWELVIADDGSDSPVQSEFIEELSGLPERCAVKVIRLDPGGNRPAARNAAMEASCAPVALLMDGDLEFGPELLRRHLEIQRETGAQAVMGRRVNAWNSNATPWQRWMDSRAMGHSPAGPFPWKYFITGNLSAQSRILMESGGFDTKIDRYGGEDTEMGFRLHAMGAVFHWDPSLSVNHLDDVTVREHSRKMLEYGGSGLLYTLRKHPEARGLLGTRLAEPLTAKPVCLFPARILVRAAVSPPVYRFLRLAEKFGGPGAVFTYLSVGACLSGFRGRNIIL